MNAKEKARDLVDRMYEFYLFDRDNEPEMKYKHAKQCALIAVNEIILNGFNPQLPYNYWLQVKQEIYEL